MAAIAGVKGQYYFSFELDGAGDFLGKSGKVHQFYMEEKIGGDVPLFKLVFSTTDSNIIKTVNEGSIVKCEFGKDIDDNPSYSEMVVQSFGYEQYGTEYLMCTLEGILRDTSKYMTNVEQKAYPKEFSIDVIKKQVEEYFTWYDETGDDLLMDDKKTWLKMGITPSKFVHETWKNSYISGGDNFLIIAIDFAGNFIVSDIKNILSGNAGGQKFKLTHEESADPTWASYNPNVQPTSDFGLLNELSLYKKKGSFHNANEDKAKTEETPDLQSYLVDSINVMSDSPIKFELPMIMDSDNNHKNQNASRYSNMTRSSLQDSVELNILIEHKWVNYELLRIVDFVPYRPTLPSLFEAETETLGGEYVITRISRFFANNRAAIEITISRDGVAGGVGGGLVGSVMSAVGNISGIINSAKNIF